MLQKRGNTFYFRWVYPSSLRSIIGQRELYKSLKTSNLHVAQLRATRYYCYVRDLKELSINMEFSPEEEAGYRKLITTLHTRLQKTNTQKPDTREELLELREKYRMAAEWYSEGTLSSDGRFSEDYPSVYRLTELFIRKVWPTIPVDEIKRHPNHYKRFIEDVTSLMRVAAESGVKSLSADENKAQLPDFLSNLISNSSDSTNSSEDESLRFSECYKLWMELKLKTGLSDRAQKAYERLYSDWNALMPDKRINDFSRRDIREFCLTITQLPRRHEKPYRGVSIHELLEMDIPKEKLVAPKSAKEARSWLQSVFSYALKQELVTESPARDLQLNLESSRSYGVYRDQEIRVFIEASQEERLGGDCWRYWVVLIAAYSGMRRGEIAQLRRSDVKKDPDTGRYYFHVTNQGAGQSVKTEAGIRIVPIHKAILDARFVEYVEGCDDSLFPDVDGQMITKWFTRLMEKLEIVRVDEYGQRRVFHSFRHTAITKAGAKGVQLAKIQQVFGHQVQDKSVTQRYTHLFPVSDVLVVIDSLDFDLKG